MKAPRNLRIVALIWLVPLLITVAVLALVEFGAPSTQSAPGPKASPNAASAAIEGRALSIQQIDAVHRLCSSCHAFPPPASFARDAWPHQVNEWFDFAASTGISPERIVSREVVLAYYDQHAPEQLAFSPVADADPPEHELRFDKRFFSVPRVRGLLPRVTNVRWARFSSESTLDCIVCDMQYQRVYLWEGDNPENGLRTIAEVAYPAHAEVVDLDGNGQRDLLVADLGTFFPSDDTLGRVLWLHRDSGTEDYTTTVLADELGRVADVQPADFDGDGDLDLVAAAFGWRAVGQVLYLENQTVDYQRPVFRTVKVDDRSGAIHVPVADLNGDGRPDFVALISQQYETIVAFLNDGPGKFRREVIYEARDPAYGSTGIQLVDLDGDADLDVLYSNGDLMDSGLLKPYHSVQWLENDGGFPFRHHHLAALPGVHRAVAGDLDGDGDNDVIASAFVPDTGMAPREAAIIWLEQTEPRQFICRVLEWTDCDHATVDLADFDHDGDLDFVTGYMTWDGIHSPPHLAPKPGSICIWENQLADSPARAAGDDNAP